ncbi:hypothetical protein RF11_10937 [Thelohanellus kitauei]|uniref:Uncharacterized protein n=1 Tax=Thelohanellus kitauei TaxID=669202 RepID=A0A0C2IG35_THEKT|nr:hypothetical protein RF11_10937 [Thelohanellus kitauei]
MLLGLNWRTPDRWQIRPRDVHGRDSGRIRPTVFLSIRRDHLTAGQAWFYRIVDVHIVTSLSMTVPQDSSLGWRQCSREITATSEGGSGAPQMTLWLPKLPLYAWQIG